MANFEDRRRSGNRVAEKFVPASDWTQDAEASYLFVDLPGFKKEELRLELASTGHITISGERIVNEKKSIYFEENFSLPENSDMDRISGKFDGDFLHVTMPRRSAVIENKQKDESKNENGHSIGANNTSLPEDRDNGENQSELEGGHGVHEQHYDDNEEKGETSKETTHIACFPLEMTMKFLKKNQGVVLSVVVAFSIGMLVCRTFESSAGA